MMNVGVIREKQPVAREVDILHRKLRAYRMLRRILVGFLLVSIVNVLFSSLFYTPKIYSIDVENRALEAKYALLQGRIAAAQSRLVQIAHRDNYVYRSLFGVDSLDYSESRMPYPSNYYADMSGGQYSPLIISTWQSLDVLAKMLYSQSLSLDDIQALAKSRDEFSEAIPAIWPIDRTLLKSGVGGFGRRLHPIYKRYIMHDGVDLACNTGSPVYATGDAVVVKSEQGYRYSGYGQMLLLQHNFGYQTRYAHLSERIANVGDTVRRGDVIGLVGSTGGSTGPHLHYEVILRGKLVDPISYFNKNMSKEEYEELMNQVQESNFERYDE